MEKESRSNYAESWIALVGGNGLANKAFLFIRFEFFLCKRPVDRRQSRKIETRKQKEKMAQTNRTIHCVYVFVWIKTANLH